MVSRHRGRSNRQGAARRLDTARGIYKDWKDIAIERVEKMQNLAQFAHAALGAPRNFL